MSNDNIQQLGQGFYWQDLSVGQRLRTHRRTITEADLVGFIGVTGMLEKIFIDATPMPGGISGRPVPALLTTALIEGFIFQTMIQGTGPGAARIDDQGDRAGACGRHDPRDRRGGRRQADLEGQPRHRRLDDHRLQPERRDRARLHRQTHARGRELSRTHHRGITSGKPRDISDAEWKVRTDLAACYRLSPATA
jgi:hypothetical protein